MIAAGSPAAAGAGFPPAPRTPPFTDSESQSRSPSESRLSPCRRGPGPPGPGGTGTVTGTVVTVAADPVSGATLASVPVRSRPAGCQ